MNDHSLLDERRRPLEPSSTGTSPKRRIFIVHGSQHLTDHSFNGDGLVAWGFIRELARRGHRITVATDRLDVRSSTPPNLTLIEFPRTNANPVLHYLSYVAHVRSYYDRLARSEGVDIVHQMNPVVRGISLAMIGRDVPVVLGTYVGDWVYLKRFPVYGKPRLPQRMSRVAKTAIDAVQQHFATSLVLATPHALQRVPLSFDVASRIEFMHHGVDTELYHPQSLTTDPPSLGTTILYVGTMTLHKGVATLAEAFDRVVREVTTARLVFVGDGSYTEQLRERFAALGLLDRITFTGRAARAEVAGWMRACDVVCAPSFGEPYGQNVLEAMASGKPVIITSEGGHRYLSDASGSLSIEPGNVAQLAHALTAILTDPERARDMGRHNRELAERQHAWPRVTDRLEGIYERAIATHRG